jgi:hypothetical protein
MALLYQGSLIEYHPFLAIVKILLVCPSLFKESPSPRNRVSLRNPISSTWWVEHDLALIQQAKLHKRSWLLSLLSTGSRFARRNIDVCHKPGS